MIRVGVGGWTYEPWRGVFYPPGLPQKRELEYAAQHVTSIEINATFYGRQKPESWRRWGEAVPDGFKFSLKASRFSTTRKWLPDAAESVGVFLGQGFTALGDRLGPIVWQFATHKAFDAAEFAGWLALLPDSLDGLPLRHALEVRHESFRDPAFYALARARNAAIVFADDDTFPCIDEPTADWAYARLMRTADDQVEGYPPRELDGWAAKARGWAERGRDVFVYFIDGAKVRNPAAAQALARRLTS
ncbi:MAG: DUF72 domain-containing protein [Novosphingobium sp.]